MNNNINIEKQKIFETLAGSYLYGTQTENSDIDYVGIFIAPADYYFGLYSVGEIDLSKKSKLESDKNDFDAIDRKFYEIKNFVNLSLKNNPNILELLYANEKSIIFKNEYYIMLQENKDLFLNKIEIFNRFVSYASSQKHKMIIKLDNYEQLASAREFFSKQDPNEFIVMFRDNQDIKSFFTEKGSHFIIGDLNFQKHLMVKKIMSALDERLSKITNRNELVLKHGYDTKFCMHLFRLLMEGKELLETEKIEFPLKYRDFLLDIKKGKYTLQEMLLMVDELEKELKESKENSKLPDTPRFNEINELIKKITKNFFIK